MLTLTATTGLTWHRGDMSEMQVGCVDAGPLHCTSNDTSLTSLPHSLRSGSVPLPPPQAQGTKAVGPESLLAKIWTLHLLPGGTGALGRGTCAHGAGNPGLSQCWALESKMNKAWVW